MSTISTVNRPVALWLFASCAMILAMVVIGGVTRLTGSGLSMVEWAPLMGWIPPLSEADWQSLFAKYQASPEYYHYNRDFNLEAFKNIFWLEYIHRVVGRLTGLVFLLPLLFFAVTGRVARALLPKLVAIFLVGGMQGLMGWYMVKSGLMDDPHVSQYRLTAHLALAFLLYCVIFWVALGQWFGVREAPPPAARRGLLRGAWGVVAVVSVTILAGGFVAGLKAGLAYNTFPLMDGRWFPEDYFLLSPALLNLFDNVPAVQWDHRLLATISAALVVLFWWRGGGRGLPPRLNFGRHLMLAMVALQYAMGVGTLLLFVPIPLASAHQAGALLLLTTTLFVTHQLRHHPEG